MIIPNRDKEREKLAKLAKREEKIDYKKQGKKNRASGAAFERKVRADLESKGLIVSKWQNTVDLEEVDGGFTGKLVPAKASRFRLSTTGFPDFVAYNFIEKHFKDYKGPPFAAVYGVEVKSNGYLDKKERAKCEWLLKNKIFSFIQIAKKGKKRGEIEYVKLTLGE